MIPAQSGETPDIPGGATDANDADRFTAHMLMEFARTSCEDGPVMQLHAGSLRNHHSRRPESFAATVLAAMRKGFGGQAVKAAE